MALVVLPISLWIDWHGFSILRWEGTHGFGVYACKVYFGSDGGGLLFILLTLTLVYKSQWIFPNNSMLRFTCSMTDLGGVATSTSFFMFSF